jgi:hypothetical protein
MALMSRNRTSTTVCRCFQRYFLIPLEPLRRDTVVCFMAMFSFPTVGFGRVSTYNGVTRKGVEIGSQVLSLPREWC